MKKGISAVIAIVLILMITVALAAMAYVFFSSVFTQISKGAQETTSGTEKAAGTQFVIESVSLVGRSAVNATIRNVGSEDIDLTKLTAYVEDSRKPINQQYNLGILKPGEYAELEIIFLTADDHGKQLRIVSDTGYEATATVPNL